MSKNSPSTTSLEKEIDKILQPSAYGFDELIEQYDGACPECMFNFKEAKSELLAILQEEIRNSQIKTLMRIYQKAMDCANQEATNYEDLSATYDKAVLKELADLTDKSLSKGEAATTKK